MNYKAHAPLPQYRTSDIGALANQTQRNQHARDVWSNALPGGGKTWVSTVINPAENYTPVEFALFWMHLIVWIVALSLSCVTNFGALTFMANSSNLSWDVNNNVLHYDDYRGFDAGSPTQIISILGGIASILGVVVLLGAASCCDKGEFAGNQFGMAANVLINMFTLFGTTSTFFVFAQAAEHPTNGYFTLALFSILFMSYAQVLLYCTSAAIGVVALPRAFIPSLAVSVQFISAIAIQGSDFAPAATNEQKTVAWMVPVSTLTGVLFMFGLRTATQAGGVLAKQQATGETYVASNIGKRPFLRSLFLTPYMVSAVLSVYKLAFVKVDPDPTSYVFAVFGMLLNFSIIGVVFNPAAKLAGAINKLNENSAGFDFASDDDPALA